MANFIVTGSSGFLGKALCTFLLKKNHKIITIPHATLSAPWFFSLKEYKHIDYIIHLSAYGNMSNQKDEFECIQANYLNTYKLLDLTKDINYKSFIFVSSSSVYGTKLAPMLEQDKINPDTFYAATKAGAEHLCRAFAKKYDKNIVSVRPFSVYGPGEADFRFIPIVCRSLIKGEQFNLYKKANHDWIYIDDIVSAIYKISKSINWSGSEINMGTGEQWSNEDIVKLLEQISGIRADYKEIDNIRKNDSFEWVADNFRLLSLGWKQKYSIREGLKKTYEYYKNL